MLQKFSKGDIVLPTEAARSVFPQLNDASNVKVKRSFVSGDGALAMEVLEVEIDDGDDSHKFPADFFQPQPMDAETAKLDNLLNLLDGSVTDQRKRQLLWAFYLDAPTDHPEYAVLKNEIYTDNAGTEIFKGTIVWVNPLKMDIYPAIGAYVSIPLASLTLFNGVLVISVTK